MYNDPHNFEYKVKFFPRHDWRDRRDFPLKDEMLDISFSLPQQAVSSDDMLSGNHKIKFTEGFSSWDKRFSGEIDFSVRIRDFKIWAGPAVITNFDC
jgi:hypothetical protein